MRGPHLVLEQEAFGLASECFDPNGCKIGVHLVMTGSEPVSAAASGGELVRLLAYGLPANESVMT